ncbi:SDR family NAD(P)-dependent oxidoreductase [Pseudovibrio sp. Alg231-02]|uniref:SDR family NAD(P)-dependent oxidoreductase n=1 Tax=Pseudovibrio sp. Alg231-02 TaxID=1922223 RepID=UPI000D55BD2A|nr:SDR family NAD(P)-dependent oxidoreductase [Pseudovibrio sp. Alg231-02]
MFNRILITGGCGFIGSNLVRTLASEVAAHEILVLDSEVTGNASSLGGVPHYFIHGDIRDQSVLEDAIKGVDAVIHLAADTRVIDSIEDPTYNFDVNVKGTLNLLEAMRKQGVRSLVNASTGGAIIGDGPQPVHESMPAYPASAYGASKAAAEAYCAAYSQSYGMDITSLRFSNVYGPRSIHKGSAIAMFVRSILMGEPCQVYGDGSQTRDFVFVEDLCQGILQSLKSKHNGVFQLGSGKPTSINEIIGILKIVSGQNDALRIAYHGFRAGEILHNFADIRKARRDLGFMPQTDLITGIQRTWDYFQNKLSALPTSDERGVPQHAD